MPSWWISAGVSVTWLRYQALMISGMLMAIAGAYLSLAQFNAFTFGVISGRGWVCIALVVLGQWDPWRCAAAALLFGLVDALQLRLQSSGVIDLPYQLFLMLPFVVTILAMALWAGYCQAVSGYPLPNTQYVKGAGGGLAGLEYLRLINWKVAGSTTQGKLDVADASSIKVFGTEFYLEAFRLAMEIIGPRAYIQQQSEEALRYTSHLEVLYRSLLILTFGGGTNEIQRDLISLFGLGFPRAPRV